MRIEGLKILKPVDMGMNVITARYWDWGWYWRGFHRAYDFAPLPEFRYTVQEPVAGIRAIVDKVYEEPGGFGLYVKLQSIDFPQLIAFKAHLAEAYVKEGDYVDHKQKVGVMGASGACYSAWGGTGEHLHDECRWMVDRGNYIKLDTAKYYKSWNYHQEAFKAWGVK